MFRRLFLLFVIVLCCSGLLRAQLGYSTSINQTFPPSPTAASLGKYGDYTLNDFTGVPRIDIPLLDIQLKNFHLPISLNYSARGVKVEDIASWVGLGWSLNTGGSITRSVQGVDDDNSNGTGILYNDWYKPGYVPDFSGTYSMALDPFGGTPALDVVTMLWWFRGHNIDTEPDNFYYDVNGTEGKFVFGLGNITTPLNQRIALIPYRDISINATLAALGSQPPPGNLNQFIITDEQGNRFFFDVVETIETIDMGGSSFISEYSYPGDPTNDFPLGGSGPGGPFYRSAWYLSKIVTVNNDEIDYTYANESYTYEFANTNTGKLFNPPANLTNAQACAMDFSAFSGNNGALSIDNMEMSVSAKRLTAITGPNFRVDFVANQSRQDLGGSQALTSMVYTSYTNGTPTVVKRFNLSYHYMTSDLSKPELQTIPGAGDSRYRLMLDNVSLLDGNGSNISNYAFQYNSSVPLPDRLSYNKDFWGYFANNQCNNPFPTIYIYPNLNFNPDVDNTYYPRYSVLPYSNYTGTTMVLPGANRNTDPTAILSGTINQITFPTGGNTTLTFEPHTFNYNSQNYVGGGLRLKQTVSYDGINHANDVIKNYSYLNTSDNTNSSGVLFNVPVYAYVENAWMNNLGNGPKLSPPDPQFYNMNLVRSDVSQATLNGFDGTSVGYREITESQPGNGKIVRRYSVPGNYGAIADYTSNGACNISQSGFCDGYFQAPLPTTYTYYFASCGSNNTPLPQDLAGTDAFQYYTYPFAPTTNYDWNRGILLQESYFDNISTLQKAVNFSYQLYSPGNTGPQTINALKKGRLLNYEFYQGSGLDNCGLDINRYGNIRYDVLAPYQILGQMCKVPSQIQTTEYDKNGNTFTTTESYTYSFHSLLPSTTRTDRSDNSSLIINSTYVTDLNLSQSSSLSSYLGYQNLLNSHILYKPVEQYQQKKNTDNSIVTIQGALMTYKPTIGKEDVSYLLRTAAPLTNFTPSTVTPTAITMDSHYKPDISFDSYDAKWNILQQTKVNDMSRSYIWDYNGIYPVAEVQNAAQSDVAYTSFEADGTGNWTVPSTSRVQAALTGSLSYNLNSGSITRGALNSGNTYIISYWSNTGSQVVNNSGPTTTGMTVSGWTYYEHVVSGFSSVTVIAGAHGGSIDELRLYPKGALMATYTYLPMVGETTACDANSKLLYYEYDAFGRLKAIRDQEKNILKTFNYQYKEQQ